MEHKATPVTPEQLQKFRAAYEADPVRRAMTHAFSMTGMNSLAFDPEASRKMLFRFSTDIKTMSATNQKSSGRCWLFAAANLLREIIAKQLNIDSFELSQSYLAFWDKFERVNYFFDTIIETAGRPADERTVAYVVSTGVGDGGQWDMFMNIVRKYGIVPKDVMPETQQSSSTANLNSVLNRFLRRGAAILRRLVAGGAAEDEIDECKNEMLEKAYKFLASCYGSAPEKFDFEYVDKDRKYHILTDLTPGSFYEQFIGDRLEEYVSIINAPTADKPYGKLYTVEYLGNVSGAPGVLYLNLEMSEFKKAILAQLNDGEPVWFGCDCGKFGESTRKIWDDNSFDFGLMTGLDQDISKEDMLDYHVSKMNHAMVLTGVNIAKDGKPDRWKIENSWGSDGANGGYHTASDSWFDKFMYQAVVNKKYLAEYAEVFGTKPTLLNAWDPMGSLAD